LPSSHAAGLGSRSADAVGALGSIDAGGRRGDLTALPLAAALSAPIAAAAARCLLQRVEDQSQHLLE